MPRKKTRKKKSSTNNITKKPENVKISEVETQTNKSREIEENSDKEIDKNVENIIPDIDKFDELQLKTRLLELENENVELRMMIEKARKKLRIYSKKLDLTEEREEQWKTACYNIAGIFAEKTQVSLEDILKRFEAPLEDGIII